MQRKKVFIIAEAGVNHNGSLKLASKMIECAANCGADAIKFQTFKAELLAVPSAPKAPYQYKTTKKGESQFEMLKHLELDARAHRALITHARKNKIHFLSSPFDMESIELLVGLGLTIFKIPSGEITNVPYLRKIGKLGKKVILSSGMSYLREIASALNILTAEGISKKNITVMHCNTEYPTPYRDVNLRAMLSIQNALGVEVGYSDHTPGFEVSLAAVALGACVIEKHFTLDCKMRGPDHKASLEPEQFTLMVEGIRNLEQALGAGIKIPSASEMRNRNIVRKGIYASCKISKGELFSENNLITKRPVAYVAAESWDKLIGKHARRDFSPDEAIQL